MRAVVEEDERAHEEPRSGHRDGQRQQIRDLERQVHQHGEHEIRDDGGGQVQQGRARGAAGHTDQALRSSCSHFVPDFEPDSASGRRALDPPAIGDLIDEVQPPTGRPVLLRRRRAPYEARPGVGDRNPHPLWLAPELHAQWPLGSRAGVTHGVGHQLGEEEKNVIPDGSWQAVVALEHGSPRCRARLNALLEDYVETAHRRPPVSRSAFTHVWKNISAPSAERFASTAGVNKYADRLLEPGSARR